MVRCTRIQSFGFGRLEEDSYGVMADVSAELDRESVTIIVVAA